MTLRFVAASGGVSSGAGAVGSPWTLDYACSSSNSTIQAGDIVFLRAGTYNERFACTKSGSSIVDGTARTDSTSANVLTATGANLSAVVVGDYIAITDGTGTGLVLGEHYPITAVDDTADTVTVSASTPFTTSGSGSNVAWRIYRPITFRSCEWSCPDGVPDYTRTYEWAKFDGYVATTLATSFGTGSCASENIVLTDGTHFPANSTFYIYDGTPAGADEYINILAKSGTNTIDNCQRNYSINSPRQSPAGPTGAIAHTAGAIVVKVGTVINVAASYNIWRDIEVMDSWPIRSYPSPAIFVANSESINVNNGSLYDDFINIVFTDNLQAIFMADGAKFSNIRGYIAYNIGVVDYVRGEGILWYLHGQTDDYRRVSHGIGFNCAVTAKAYGVTGGADNFIITDNTHFNMGALGPLNASNPAGYQPSHRFCAFQLSADSQPPTNNSFKNNWAWNGPDTVAEGGTVNFGFTSSGDILEMRDNYIVARGGSALYFNHFNNATWADNTIIQGQTETNLDGVQTQILQTAFTITELSNFSMSNTAIYNLETLGATGSTTSDVAGCKDGAYGTSGAEGPCLHPVGSALLYLDSSALGTAEDPGGSGQCGGTNLYRFRNGCLNSPQGTGWKQWTGKTGFTVTTGYPTTNVTRVIPNLWETGRCVMRMLNWQKLSSVSFNLSTCGLAHGDDFAIWDVQDFTAWDTGTAITTGTYDSGSPSVSITVSGLTGVTQAIGTIDGNAVELPDNTAQDADAPLIVLIARRTGATGGGAPSTAILMGQVLT